MVDITKAKRAFKEYVKNYDITNKKIQLKIAHIERTAEISRKIAKSMNLSEEKVELAELIGLLHDIGRFEQVRKYNTFVDHLSENHAQIGVDVLFRSGKIREFIEDDKYDKIIELAIINHNKDKKDLPKNLSEDEDLFVKLIRDSDKTDILYILTFENEKTVWDSDNLEEEKFTEEIYNEFMNDRAIKYSNMKTHADRLIANFAYVFDFNYDFSLNYVYEKGYFDEIYKRFNFKNEQTNKWFNEIYKETIRYIKERLGK